MLSTYLWPGNLRELQNFVERVSVLLLNENKDEQLEILVKQLTNQKDSIQATDNNNFKDWQEKRFVAAIKLNNGNISKAAISLGISRTTLWRKLKEYKIKL